MLIQFSTVLWFTSASFCRNKSPRVRKDTRQCRACDLWFPKAEGPLWSPSLSLTLALDAEQCHLLVMKECGYEKNRAVFQTTWPPARLVCIPNSHSSTMYISQGLALASLPLRVLPWPLLAFSSRSQSSLRRLPSRLPFLVCPRHFTELNCACGLHLQRTDLFLSSSVTKC
jgi:hypothetical protein